MDIIVFCSIVQAVCLIILFGWFVWTIQTMKIADAIENHLPVSIMSSEIGLYWRDKQSKRFSVFYILGIGMILYYSVRLSFFNTVLTPFSINVSLGVLIVMAYNIIRIVRSWHELD